MCDGATETGITAKRRKYREKQFRAHPFGNGTDHRPPLRLVGALIGACAGRSRRGRACTFDCCHKENLHHKSAAEEYETRTSSCKEFNSSSHRGEGYGGCEGCTPSFTLFYSVRATNSTNYNTCKIRTPNNACCTAAAISIFLEDKFLVQPPHTAVVSLPPSSGLCILVVD